MVLPTTDLWKKWNALDKATYIAQLSAPIALVVTVIFSFLAWQEAKIARKEQRDFFLSQNAPELVLSGARIVQTYKDTRVLTLEISNIGETTAHDICVQVFELIEYTMYADTCEEGAKLWNRFTIRGGRSESLPLVNVEQVEEGLGYIPSEAAIFSFGEAPEEFKTNILVSVNYVDPGGNQIGLLESIFTRP